MGSIRGQREAQGGVLSSHCSVTHTTESLRTSRRLGEDEDTNAAVTNDNCVSPVTLIATVRRSARARRREASGWFFEC
jgi:hypothetical protein